MERGSVSLVRNKILIVNSHVDEREELEQILQEIVQEGGELFFADKIEDGLAIMKKESPPLILINAQLIGEDRSTWIQEGVHVIFIRRKSAVGVNGENDLSKPFKAHQVLEKCRVWLGKEPVAQAPPM